MFKKKLLLLFCLFNFYSHSQNSEFEKLNSREIKNLSTLCKVWGFLKYYHPAVAKGNYKFDEDLLNLLPIIKQAKNKEELSVIYLNWIEKLGGVKECKSCNRTSNVKYFNENFNLNWIEDDNTFTDELVKKLKYIEKNRFHGDNYYVTTANAGNIIVKHEEQYPNFEYPDANYRLLSLFRYWNLVEYFFPYKYQMDERWDNVLIEMIPRFVNAKNATEYQLSILETVIKLDDTHAILYSEAINNFIGRKWIPFSFLIIDNKAVITNYFDESLAKENDLKIGDVIEKIENRSISDILNEKLKYINGSNYNAKLKNAYAHIFNGSTDSLKITFNRNGIVTNKTIARYLFKNFKIKKEVGEKYKLLDNNIGYVNMSFLEMKDVDKMMSDLQSATAIIIDYRKFMNFTPYMIARRIIQKEKEFAKFTKPDLSYPGKFIWDKTETITPIKNKYYPGKIILLVNEETQSASEYATMLLQTSENAITIGSQTSGADGNVSTIEFIGFKSHISGIGVFYPDGTQTQRKGVKVDILVSPTIKGIQEGRDEVLEKALQFIKESKNKQK